MMFAKILFLLVTLLTYIIIVTFAESDCEKTNQNHLIIDNTLPSDLSPPAPTEIKQPSEDVETRSKRQAVYKAHFPSFAPVTRTPDRQNNLRQRQGNPVRYVSNYIQRNTYRANGNQRRQATRPTRRTNANNVIKKKKFKPPPVMF